jgi:hypothetical protein
MDSTASGGIQKPRQRAITSCLTCRRRKVKCDHAQPVCSPCQKGHRACSYAGNQHTPAQPAPNTVISRAPRSNLRAGQDEIRQRLDRVEKLLERAIAGAGTAHPPDPQVPGPEGVTARPKDPNPPGESLAGDGYDGALLLGAGSGQSRWVSSLHYALLADEV